MRMHCKLFSILVSVVATSLVAACDSTETVRSRASNSTLDGDASRAVSGEQVDAAPPRAEVERTQRTTSALFSLSRLNSGQLRVGLKLANANRGIWRGRWLLTEKERETIALLVAAEVGAKIVSYDRLLPIAVLSLDDQTAIQRLRDHQNVDYVAPVTIPSEEFHLNLGCDQPTWSGGALLAAPVGGGDLISNQFAELYVDRAWRYGNYGNGVTIGWVDTGVDASGTWPEVSAMSGRLTALAPNNGTDCSHGNRMASVSSASANGTGSVGVAFYSTVLMSDIGGTVFPSGVAAYDALHRLFLTGGMPAGGKIIALGWGLSGVATDVSDLIDFGYYTRGFAFFAPAGSAAAGLPVVFPASKAEVFAATARTSAFAAHPKAHVGPAVDGIAFAPVFVSGSGGSQIGLDASSAATAQIAGAAAQVLQKYPSFTNAQIYDRLRSTAREFCGPANNGITKIINVEAAVGGLCVPPSQFNEVTYTFYNGAPSSLTHSYCFAISGGVWPQYSVGHINPHPYLPGCGSVTLYPDAANPDRTITIQATAWDNYTPSNPPIVNYFRIRVRSVGCPPELPNCV